VWAEVREYVRVFRVILTFAEIQKGPKTIRELPGIPAIDDTYVGIDGETDDDCTCRSIDSIHNDDGLTYLVTVKYSNEARDECETEENPFDRPPKIRWDVANKTKAAPLIDLDSKIVRNTAGWPFDPVPDLIKTYLTLSITRYEAEFDIDEALQYVNATNSDAWEIDGHTFEVGSARCSEISTGDKQCEGGYDYREVTYKFEFSPIELSATLEDEDGSALVVGGGFDTWLLNQGPYYLTLSPLIVKPPRDRKFCRRYFKDAADGTPSGDMGLLDRDGTELDRDADPLYLRFRFLERRPFVTLGLPNNRPP